MRKIYRGRGVSPRNKTGGSTACNALKRGCALRVVGDAVCGRARRRDACKRKRDFNRTIKQWGIAIENGRNSGDLLYQ